MQNRPSTPLGRESLPTQLRKDVQTTSPLPQSHDPWSETSSSNTTKTATSLCTECKRIDWQSVVLRLQRDREKLGMFARHRDKEVQALDLPIDLPPWSTPTNHISTPLDCPMCSYFSELKQEAGYDDTTSSEVLPADKVLVDLLSFTADRDYAPVVAFRKDGQAHYGSLTGILHAGSSNDLHAPRVMDPFSIDWSIVRGWLHDCADKHNWKCRPTSEEPPLGFRVIDVRSGEVIKAPVGCEYVALSYVWGRQSPEEAEGYPLTIQDAMKVTSTMGFDYLWIDRYCIDQTNLVEKLAQISRMDRIYSGAALVIIAAAGSDPHYGLPGVSTRGRLPQRVIETGNCTLVETFPDVNATLMKSTWRSRAWTFQEGYLAKRRLVFTDYQVSLTCSDGTCIESMTSRFSHVTINTNLSLKTLFFSHRFYTDYNGSDVLKEYTTRDLSFAGDALHACAGIFSFWANSSLYQGDYIGAHLWGLTYDAAWLNLNWHHERPGERRIEFPSWSWLGWKGGVDFKSSQNTPSTSIEVGMGTSGPWTSVAHCFAKLQETPVESRIAPRALRLRGICPLFKLAYDPDTHAWSGSVPESPTHSYPCAVFLDDNVKPETDRTGWIAMLLIYYVEPNWGPPPPPPSPEAYSDGGDFVLLRPAATKGVYERVALMRTSGKSEVCSETWDEPILEARMVVVE